MGRPNRASALRDQLEQEILGGQLKAGAHLDEISLSLRFDTSRTPVREALLQLSVKGLVEIHAGRGAFVKSTSMAIVVEMFEVMAELEAMCGQLAARRATPRSLAALAEANRVCKETADAGEPDAYYYANAVFHRAIYEASGNSFLATQAEDLHIRLQPYRRLQLRAANRMAQSLREHQDITNAIVHRDPVAAADALRSHVLVQGSRFTDFFAAISGQAREDLAMAAPGYA